MKVSIITTVYNNRTHIADAIESVLSQDYPNIEYIVVDGASTDNTQDIIKKYKEHIDTYSSEKDAGMFDAFNKGVRLATGDLIGFLHSDDLYCSNTIISELVEHIQQTKADSIYGDIFYISKNTKKKIRYWKAYTCSRKKMLFGWMPPHPSWLIKRSIYEKYGLYDQAYSISADYEMSLRLLYKEGISAAYYPAPILKMRVGGISNRFTNLPKIYREDLTIALKYNLPYPRFSVFFKKAQKLYQLIAKPPYPIS